jgi:prepilin-type N-terminal cleavage/methylation domain-containing protein
MVHFVSRLRECRGFTLLELLVAICASALVVGAVSCRSALAIGRFQDARWRRPT